MLRFATMDEWWRLTAACPDFRRESHHLLKDYGYLKLIEFIESVRPKRLLEFGHGFNNTILQRFQEVVRLNRIRFDTRDQSYSSHVARVRTELSFSTSTSAAAFAQYNSAGDVVVLNFRFRYNPSEGNDLYLVWNESLNSDRFGLSPAATRGPLRCEP